MPSYVSSTFVTILVLSFTFVSAAPASQEGEYELQFEWWMRQPASQFETRRFYAKKMIQLSL